MLARKTCWRATQLGHGDGLPLQVADGADPRRSRTARSSRRGIPARSTIGSPASSWMMSGPDEVHADVDLAGGQGLAEGRALADLDVLHVGEPLGLQELFGHDTGGRYRCAGYWASLSRVVSGGGSAATGLGCTPRSPAVPASVNPPRNLRRLNGRACWLCMGTSLPDAGHATPSMPASGRHYIRLSMMAHADGQVCTGSRLALPAVLTLDNWPHTGSCPLL